MTVVSIITYMFGLMRTRGCGLGQSARELRRLHYCGTCKAIGGEYGHASRLLLNDDTVLVAEIVTALSGQPDWQANIRTRNCFKMPERPDDVPVALRYAAAATVLLATGKVRDHVSDSTTLVWRALSRWLDPRYRRAAAQLRHWGVPVEQIERQLASQKQREAAAHSLEQLAEPTCFATAMICRSAARLAGRQDGEPFAESVGRRFGYLIYLLDAWEDFDRDARRGEFNAFRSMYGARECGRQDVITASHAVEQAFRELPVAERFRDELLLRLRMNLRSRMGVDSVQIHIRVPTMKTRIFAGFRDRFRGTAYEGCVEGGGGCVDCFAESCVEAICDSICG